jgi:hypothetical protein
MENYAAYCAEAFVAPDWNISPTDDVVQSHLGQNLLLTVTDVGLHKRLKTTQLINTTFTNKSLGAETARK